MTKRFRKTSIAAMLCLLFSVLVFASPVNAAGGSFWFYDGDAQAGQYKGYSMSLGWSGNLSGQRFTFNCAAGTCAIMDNRIESIKFECSSMDSNDRLSFYTGYDFNGTLLGTVWFIPAQCSNGVYNYELPTSWDNLTSSVKFIES